MNQVLVHIKKTLPWLLLFPVLFPLLVGGGLMYPYLVPKTLGFYTVGLLSLGAFFFLALSGNSFYSSRLRSPRMWIPGALLILAYIASLAGLDFYRSFWSLYVRGDGLLTLTLSVAAFYGILLTADEFFLRKLLRGIAGVGTAVAIYGIGEWLLGGGRIGGLLGNAAFFAGYLGISLFVTLACARSLRTSLRRTAYVGAALQVVAIILSATRGTMLALLASGLVVLVDLAITGRGKIRTISISLFAALIIFSTLFFAFRSELRTVSFGPIARVASISVTDPDVSSRLFIWKHMIGEIEKSPWLGVGAEHIDVLFNRFYDPTAISEEWFDRSHNAYLDYAAQYGLGGLVLYLTLIGAFLYTALRYRKRDFLVGNMLALAVLVYAIQNFFVFDTISSWWTFLALFAALSAVSIETAPSRLPVRSSALGVVLGLGSFVLIVPTAVMPLLANRDLFEGYLYQIADVTRANQTISNGVALHTYGDIEYGYQLYSMYTGTQATTLSGEARVGAYEVAKNILTTNFNRYTYDARTALYLAHVLSLAPPEETPDTTLLRAALERTISLSPKRSQAWYLLLNLSIAQANVYPPNSPERIAGYKNAAATLRGYELLVPTLAQPHFVEAELYQAAGDTQNARAEAVLGRQYYVPDLETARRAVGYYEGVSDMVDTAFFLGEITTLVPSDYVSWYDLAKAKYLLGDKGAAESIVAMLRTKDPSIVASDPAFLAAITHYEQSPK